MDDYISRQVLDLWNRYKPTIAVDAIEYDRELKKLLSTNLAEVGTDCISRRAAINKILGQPPEPHYPSWYAEQIKELPPAEPKRAKWERHYSRPGIFADLCWHCSACGYKSSDGWANKFNFCPNCGSYNGGET